MTDEDMMTGEGMADAIDELRAELAMVTAERDWLATELPTQIASNPWGAQLNMNNPMFTQKFWLERAAQEAHQKRGEEG